MITVMTRKNMKRNKPSYGSANFARRSLYNLLKINSLRDYAQLFFKSKIKTRKLKICKNK
jgi:hypothetical protein